MVKRLTVWQLKVELKSLRKLKFYPSVVLLMTKMTQSAREKLPVIAKSIPRSFNSLWYLALNRKLRLHIISEKVANPMRCKLNPESSENDSWKFPYHLTFFWRFRNFWLSGSLFGNLTISGFLRKFPYHLSPFWKYRIIGLIESALILRAIKNDKKINQIRLDFRCSLEREERGLLSGTVAGNWANQINSPISNKTQMSGC